MKRAFLIFFSGCLFIVSRGSAHVGSPDVFYEGKAGPYLALCDGANTSYDSGNRAN